MENTNGDHKAYPVSATAAKLITDGYGFPDEYLGMTKLEAFTMAAMQGLSSIPYMMDLPDEIAYTAVDIAKATIKALNSNQ